MKPHFKKYIFSFFIIAGLQAHAVELRETREFRSPGFGVSDIVSFPFYVPEYALRIGTYPITKFIEYSDRAHLHGKVLDILSNDEKTSYGFPYLIALTGDGIGVGATYRHTDLFKEGKQLYLNANYFFNKEYSASFRVEKPIRPTSGSFYSLGTEISSDVNMRYYGEGTQADEAFKSLYTLDTIHSAAEFGWEIFKYISVSVHGGHLNTRTSPSPADGTEPSIATAHNTSLVNGFGERIGFFYVGGEARYDSRNSIGFPSRGGLLRARISNYSALGDAAYGFNRFYTEFNQYVDLYQGQRVLALNLQLESIEPSGLGIPFQLLSTLGGRDRLRGFREGRFRNVRTFLASLEYRFTIWKLENPGPNYGIGFLFYDWGKDFLNFEELKAGGFRYSVGMGLMAVSKEDFIIRGQVGYGGEVVRAEVATRYAF